MKNKKIISTLFIVSLCILIFVGCSSMETPIAITKTIYSNTLKTLVDEGTITQTQSNKVLGEVLSNMKENKGNMQGLRELVLSGEITKRQANLINKKIAIALMKYPKQIK